MNPSFGDLAQVFHLQRGTADLKSRLTAMSKELASGSVSDPLRHLGGDVGVLSGLERDLRLETAYTAARNEASAFAAAQQTVLQKIHDLAEAAGSEMVAAATSGDNTRTSVALSDVADHFATVIGALNTTVGGRALFAGADTRGTAVASAEDILGGLSAGLTGATTAGDVLAVVDDWFMSAGGGFETVGYQGSDEPLSPFLLDESTRAKLDVTAADDGLRRVLRALSIGALLEGGMLAGDPLERQALMESIGVGLLGATGDVISVQAGIGAVENRIEDAQVRGSARNAALEMTRKKLIGVDLESTVTRIDSAQVQLEAIYLLTSRMSAMSLTSVLR